LSVDNLEIDSISNKGRIRGNGNIETSINLNVWGEGNIVSSSLSICGVDRSLSKVPSNENVSVGIEAEVEGIS